jgi:predicted type IV restriction endonuclease
MALDKATLSRLERFATAFKEARERGANESETVMFIVKFCEELLGYDSLKGEISKEVTIKDRYCDIALKVGGDIRVLIECKAASVRGLAEKHIEQAGNYASRAGIRWVLLTNGIEWKLFHLAFAEGEGITHEIAFDANLVEDIGTKPEELWTKLSLLTRTSVADNRLDQYWDQKKALSPVALVRVLFTEEVLTAIRRELNRKAPARLDIEDVSNAVLDVLSKEALAEAGDITTRRRRKRRRRRKVTRTDAVTGQTVTQEVEEEVADDEPGSLETDDSATDPPPA